MEWTKYRWWDECFHVKVKRKVLPRVQNVLLRECTYEQYMYTDRTAYYLLLSKATVMGSGSSEAAPFVETTNRPLPDDIFQYLKFWRFNGHTYIYLGGCDQFFSLKLACFLRFSNFFVPFHYSLKHWNIFQVLSFCIQKDCKAVIRNLLAILRYYKIKLRPNN